MNVLSIKKKKTINMKIKILKLYTKSCSYTKFCIFKTSIYFENTYSPN